MIGAIRGSLHAAVCDNFRDGEQDRAKYSIDTARANTMRLARLDCFAALCVGGAGHAALTPGRALALVKDALDAGQTKWEEALERWYDDESEQLAEEETVEVCLSALVRAELTVGGGSADHDAAVLAASTPPPPALLRFEEELEDELRAREAALDAHTLDDAPHTARKQERTQKAVEQILAALRAQISTLAPSQSLSAPTVVPLALSDADFMPGALFGNGSTYSDGELRTWFTNDHEGRITYVCVAEAWVAIVCMKVAS